MDRGASHLVLEEEVELVDGLREVRHVNTTDVAPLLGNLPLLCIFVAANFELITVRMETSFPFRRSRW